MQYRIVTKLTYIEGPNNEYICHPPNEMVSVLLMKILRVQALDLFLSLSLLSLSSFISFAEIMILKVYELKVDVRKMRFTDQTDYDRVYKRASAYTYEFFQQYADTVRASLTAFTSHSSAEAGAILQHVLSTEVISAAEFTHTGFANMRAAASLASNESATPVYEFIDENEYSCKEISEYYPSRRFIFRKKFNFTYCKKLNFYK